MDGHTVDYSRRLSRRHRGMARATCWILSITVLGLSISSKTKTSSCDGVEHVLSYTGYMGGYSLPVQRSRTVQSKINFGANEASRLSAPRRRRLCSTNRLNRIEVITKIYAQISSIMICAFPDLRVVRCIYVNAKALRARQSSSSAAASSTPSSNKYNQKRKQSYVKSHGVRIYTAGRKFPNCDKNTEVSIATFNILQKNFNFSKKPWVLPEHADWEHRLALLQGVLRDLNTDIICLQEADIETFESDFAEHMSLLGYDTVPPSAKNTRDIDHGHTKPSIFFKRSKFMLHWHNPRSRTTLIALEIRENADDPSSSSSGEGYAKKTTSINTKIEGERSSDANYTQNDDDEDDDDREGTKEEEKRTGGVGRARAHDDNERNDDDKEDGGDSGCLTAAMREGAFADEEGEEGVEDAGVGGIAEEGFAASTVATATDYVSAGASDLLIEGGVPSPGGGIERIPQPMTQYGQMIYIANCHLQCGGSAGGVNVHHTRVLQMRSALRRMRWHMIRHNIDISDVALFVCGDFNCPPSDPVCQLLSRGYNTAEEVEHFFKGNDLAFENEIVLTDSHKFLRETRRRFPTFVRRASKGSTNRSAGLGLTMDYIFYTPNTMKLLAVRDPFTREQKVALKSSGLFPNHWHPSEK
eukprot:jgi/Bigna1/75986/fgenesh1_pg.38_\